MADACGLLTPEELHWLLGSLCTLYRIPFDSALIEQSFPPPHHLAAFHAAARTLGFKTGQGPHPDDWQKLPLPAIAFLGPVPAHGQGEPTAATVPVLILKTDGHKLLYFRAGSQTPETIAVEEAAARFEPELIPVAREAAGQSAAVASFATEKRAFGFQWFIPELLKHKPIWRDVLLACLAIQLVGLATPLFTQVIIDKVVVHQTHSTLVVLGVALAMFMLFASGMTWLRQYLVLHTGCRAGQPGLPAPAAPAPALLRTAPHRHPRRKAAWRGNHPGVRLRCRDHPDPRLTLSPHLPGDDVRL